MVSLSIFGIFSRPSYEQLALAIIGPYVVCLTLCRHFLSSVVLVKLCIVTAVARQLQPQLQLRLIAETIALCKHRVRGLTKSQVTSVLRLSPRTLSSLHVT